MQISRSDHCVQLHIYYFAGRYKVKQHQLVVCRPPARPVFLMWLKFKPITSAPYYSSNWKRLILINAYRQYFGQTDTFQMGKECIRSRKRVCVFFPGWAGKEKIVSWQGPGEMVDETKPWQGKNPTTHWHLEIGRRGLMTDNF